MFNNTTKEVVECIGATFNCSDPLPNCQNLARFDLPSLWTITVQYAQQCPNGPWLFKPPGSTTVISQNRLSLTNDVCKFVAGSGWKKYPGSDIWARLTTWKFPLFQLVANSPRPPLGFWVEGFTFVHFLGDPIGTISDLLHKIDGCQNRAVFWQDRLDSELALLRDERTELERRRLWKSMAMIVDSFDEWGPEVGDYAQGYFLAELMRLCSPDVYDSVRRKYIRICLQTGDALAADRSTKFVPVSIAQAFFIGSVAIAMIRTRSSSTGPNPTTYANIEMWSIAFTAQYFWVIFTVLWTSIIGTSQTAAALPRILDRLNKDLQKEMSEHGIHVNLPIEQLDDDRRIYNGGIYSWQPNRRGLRAAHNSTLERKTRRESTFEASKIQRLMLATILRGWPVIQYFLPLTIVATAAFTGQLISALVPPVGWTCRSSGMMWMFLGWVGSYIASFIPCRNNRLHFWVTFIKDFIAIGITTGIVMMTQFGIYNKCDCYTQFGRVGLQLPFMPLVRDALQSKLGDAFPVVVTLGIAFQLIIVPCLLVWRYHAAVQVFLQRDDGLSNLDWTAMFQVWRRRKQYEGMEVALESGEEKTRCTEKKEEAEGRVVKVENVRDSDSDRISR